MYVGAVLEVTDMANKSRISTLSFGMGPASILYPQLLTRSLLFSMVPRLPISMRLSVCLRPVVVTLPCSPLIGPNFPS
jgi:hypothetical protein